MDSKWYLSLNSWLQKADQNYIEGRLLWLNWLVNGASNLLWLSLEQMIKILLLQKRIDSLSSQVNNLDDLHNLLDSEGKKIGHNVHDLIQQIKKMYPDLDIDKFEETLKKLQEYFYRRYVVNSRSSISLLMLDNVDKLYFLLRSKVDSDIGPGTIDEIFIQRKYNWWHPLSAFAYAYLQNKYFKTRKHREIKYSAFDGTGKTYTENGT